MTPIINPYSPLFNRSFIFADNGSVSSFSTASVDGRVIVWDVTKLVLPQPDSEALAAIG